MKRKLALALAATAAAGVVAYWLFASAKQKRQSPKKFQAPPQTFATAVEFVSTNGDWVSSLSDERQLRLYALFKQATEGPNQRPKPSSLNFVAAVILRLF